MVELTVNQKIELFKIAIEYSKVVDAIDHTSGLNSETLISIRFLYLLDLFTENANLESAYGKNTTIPSNRFSKPF